MGGFGYAEMTSDWSCVKFEHEARYGRIIVVEPDSILEEDESLMNAIVRKVTRIVTYFGE